MLVWVPPGPPMKKLCRGVQRGVTGGPTPKKSETETLNQGECPFHAIGYYRWILLAPCVHTGLIKEGGCQCILCATGN